MTQAAAASEPDLKAAQPARQAPDTADGVLPGLWYLAACSADLKPGRMLGKTLFGAPVLLGRTRDGAAFALRDLCPHRGVRLSEGRFDGAEIACPFHGWRFGANGACKRVPSLAPGQQIDLNEIATPAYSVSERQGCIWIKAPGADGAAAHGPEASAPEIPEIGERAPKVSVSLRFETDMDNAVFGLLDPAHGPYVHQSRLWRRPDKLADKEKRYAPSDLGFTMLRHPPSSNSVIYKFLGDAPTTEISFRLPGVRLEHVRVGSGHICNFTAMTPIDGARTEVTNLLYWTTPALDLLTPFIHAYARRFLGQDQWIIGLQNETKPFAPDTMLIRDADALQRWYLRLKDAWRRAVREERAFVNPIEPATLRWRT
ncbi:MAG: aromatic ring-hydroxylating dioxygenase subunit alpha [Pseudomonadota bacterium]